MVETGDEVGTADVCWVKIWILGRDELADADTVIDHDQPVTSCSRQHVTVIIISIIIIVVIIIINVTVTFVDYAKMPAVITEVGCRLYIYGL